MLMRFKFSSFAARCATLPMVLLLVVMSAAMVAQAAEVKGLYSVEVPVHGQGDAERLQAIRAGIGTVLVKVSGRREASALPALAAVLESPMQLVQRFRYHVLPEQWQQAIDAQGQFYSQLLRIRFDDQAVNRVLRQASLPVWGRARPATLIWLAVEDWNQRSIVGADKLQALRQALMLQASQRGLPIIFPLLDLQDQTRLGFADIWGDFEDDILQASARYQAGGVLVGRLYRQSADQWQARWTLYQGDDVQRWQTEGLQQQQVLMAGLDGTADFIAERFARLPGESGDRRVAVLIHDVTSLAAYARVMQYLESLDLTKDVVVKQLVDDSVIFALTVRGELQGFEQAVMFGDTLAPLKTADGAAEISGAAMVADGSDGADSAIDGVADSNVDRSVLLYRLLP